MCYLDIVVTGDAMNSDSEYEVVISGIGAKLPNSKDIKEFGEKLFSKTNLLEVDWVRFIPGI